MKIPTWLIEDFVEFEAPAIVEAVNEISVTTGLLFLQGEQKLPAPFAAIVDPQAIADLVQTVLRVSAGVICDKAGWSLATKAKLLADITATPAVIPIKRAEAV